MAHRHRPRPWPRFAAIVTDFIRSLTPPTSGSNRVRKSRTRKTGIGMLTIGVTLAATCLAAFANAANPFTDATHQTTGTATINANGTVSVHVTGTWNWGSLSGSSAQNKCENRYGVGWAVDWSGVSPLTTPGFSWAIKSTPKTYFHVVQLDGGGNFVTSHAMDGVHQFTGPCTAQELALDPTGPSGDWSADFVYPNVASVPPQLCANFYDLHGTPGNISNAKDLDPTQNGDNSIKTNSFNPAVGQGFCFAPTFVTPVQHLVGHIYDCGNGPTANEVPGGTLSASGPSTVNGQANPLNATVNSGNYTVTAGAPANHHFVDCGSGATIANPTSATKGVTVPSNGTGTAIFYVAPDTQALAGHIYDCTAGATTNEVAGGTLSATGPTNVASQANPLNAGVNAGGYTVTAGAPAGHHFVTCGSTATITNPTTATEAVNVPANGTGTATFYVVPDVQTLAGHIYDCTSGVSTNEVAGGTLGASGPTAVASQGNPLAAHVSPGNYTVNAGAPNGYHFVDCGSGATITNPTSAMQAVSVPTNGTGTATFYVVPDTQALLGHIYDCTSGATTTEVLGGSLSATGPTTVASHANPLAAANIDAGQYTVNAIAPTNHHFVNCGSSVNITSPTSADEGVSVPTNGTGTATFYVAPDAQALIGHIYDCSNGATANEVPGGTLSAAGPTTVASQANPLNAANVDAGAYVVTAGAPHGYHFVGCGSSATITSPSNATEAVDVPSGGTGTARFYVSPNVAVLSISVDKTNDASGDGKFGDDETGTFGDDVTFRLTITNHSAVAVVIDSINDVWPGATTIAPACATSVVGATLPANGGSITCEFTLEGYVPPSADGAKVNTATVVVHEAGKPDNSVSGSDTSTVRGAEVLGLEVTRAPETPAAPAAQALPRTGAGSTKPLFLLGIVLIALGAMLSWLNNPLTALLAAHERRQERSR